ncbi:MAG TPA: CoA transferase, partial [Amycolatopsis sp.]|nr:CoA transferase [Amycolatopsis sp.]
MDRELNGERPGALSGLRVVDLSQTPPGAQATQLLADFGAEVLYLEPPGGSPLRRQAAWPFWARGKRSLEVDLRDPGDLAVARQLAEGADVVLESFRLGVADRLGLGYRELAAANPGLIYTSITGFPATGPYASAPGYEPLVMARAGALDQFAEIVERPGPVYVPTPYCGFSA